MTESKEVTKIEVYAAIDGLTPSCRATVVNFISGLERRLEQSEVDKVSMYEDFNSVLNDRNAIRVTNEYLNMTVRQLNEKLEQVEREKEEAALPQNIEVTCEVCKAVWVTSGGSKLKCLICQNEIIVKPNLVLHKTQKGQP